MALGVECLKLLSPANCVVNQTLNKSDQIIPELRDIQMSVLFSKCHCLNYMENAFKFPASFSLCVCVWGAFDILRLNQS